MSLITDFELAWKPFEDKIISYIAKNTSGNKFTELDGLQSFYNRLIRMWEDPTRVQCGFLSKWKTVFPELEKDFVSILHEFEFQEPENTKKVSPAISIGGTVIVAAAGGIIGHILPESNYLKVHLGNIPVILIGIFVFSAVGGGIIKSLYDNAVRKSCQESAQLYNEQIEKLYAKLLDLCKRLL